MNKVNRITSIDALRGVVLLGILIVHTAGLFGFASNSYSFFTDVDLNLQQSINLLLSGRCNIVFSILFGVSFYLILKNPQFSSVKFAWRCLLLLVCGIIIKIFYTYDALMWYGMMGIILIIFRYQNKRFLLFSFLLLYFLSAILMKFSLGNLIFGESHGRYLHEATLYDIISYPIIESVQDYLRSVFNGGILRTLSYFILGYYFAKSGIIENLRAIKHKYILYTGCLYLILYITPIVIGNYHTLFRTIANLFGGLFYTLCFLFIYNYLEHKKSMLYLMKGFEAYGKLGLTNYCMQNILGVIGMATIFIPYKFQFVSILACSILFYCLQMLFSVTWLYYFKYGPFEWCWRCLTNIKYITNYKF